MGCLPLGACRILYLFTVEKLFIVSERMFGKAVDI